LNSSSGKFPFVNLKFLYMKKNNFLLVVTALCIVVFIGYSCGKSSSSTPYSGGGGTPPPPPAGSAVIMQNMTFVPSSISVAKGTTITWTNHDSYDHTVTSNDNGATFNSGTVHGSGTFTYTPTAAGTIPYHCLIHGLMMSGIITVTQ
jgi:plastocyanin